MLYLFSTCCTMICSEKGVPTEAATDLPDKPTGGGKLGKKGERRFAPATTRRWAEFVNIQPAQWGGVWLKIGAGREGGDFQR
jgi:hypothetical protein